MEGFRHIEGTDFAGYSAAELRAFARAVSSDGVAADAAAIAESGAVHAQSLAELSRDSASLAPRWTGLAAQSTFETVATFVAASYRTSLEAAKSAAQVESLSLAAQATHDRYAEFTGDTAWLNDRFVGIGSTVAGELRATYTAPVQADASTMPLTQEERGAAFDMNGTASTRDGSPAPSDAPSVDGGARDGGPDGAGRTEAGSGGGPSGPQEALADSDTDPGSTDPTPRAQPEEGEPGRPSTATDAATDAGIGRGQGAGAETMAAEPGLDPSATEDLPSYAGDPERDDEPSAAPLLTRAATVPGSPTSRAPGIGPSAVRAPSAASPLGLRPDAATLRGGAVPAASAAAPTGTGARPASGPYGMPPGAAGAQRGSGDGRHRVPAYLIDRANGEELVGELPLVGPGVIGQWRADGAPDPRRVPAPPPGAPATAGPRRR